MAVRKHATKSPTKEKALGEMHVNMSNALVRAAQGLSLTEKRIMSCAVAKLDSVRSWTPEKLRVRLTAVEYAEAFGVDESTAYTQLQEGADKLFHRYASWTEKGRKGDIIVKSHWCGSVKYYKGEGWIELLFHHEIAPHLFLLRKQFTSYKLSQASALRSLYSWRLLELLMQFKSKGHLTITIEDFAEAMDAPQSMRANFAAMRRRIIEPAVKELTEKDHYILAWEPVKAGRRVKALKFDFKPDPQQRLDL